MCPKKPKFNEQFNELPNKKQINVNILQKGNFLADYLNEYQHFT